MPQHLLLLLALLSQARGLLLGLLAELLALLGESGVQLPALCFRVAPVDCFPIHTATAATVGEARASTIDVHSGTTVTAAGHT
jgi:hypothetical protein